MFEDVRIVVLELNRLAKKQESDEQSSSYDG